MNLKIISWNVNGIRAIAKKGFYDFIKEYKPDVLCLQETKANLDQLDEELVNINGYTSYFNSADKKGYSGTAIYTKVKPINVIPDMGVEMHDKEGRILTAEFEKFYVTSVYVPNSKPDLARLDERQVWDRDLLVYFKKLEEDKPVVFGGDLNVAHKEIDLARPKDNVGKHGFTDEERAGFQLFMDASFIDTLRLFEQGPDFYTWWSYFGGARARNVGWRIDYLLASSQLKDNIKKAFILPEVMGSDHCPVGIDMEI